MKSFWYFYILSFLFEFFFLILNERCCDFEDVLFFNYLNVFFCFEICVCRIEIIRGWFYKFLMGCFLFNIVLELFYGFENIYVSVRN